jgi:hypothetical protein
MAQREYAAHLLCPGDHTAYGEVVYCTAKADGYVEVGYKLRGESLVRFKRLPRHEKVMVGHD